MKVKILLFFVIGSVLITSCVSTEAVRLGNGPIRPPVPWDKVIIYRTADQVPGKYEEVSILSSKEDSIWTNEEQMYKEMRKKAGKLGANAIVGVDIDYEVLGQGGNMLMVTASGTAVTVE